MQSPARGKAQVRVIAPTDTNGVKVFARLDRVLSAAHGRHVPATRADLVKRLTGRAAIHADIEHSLFVASDDDGRDIACCAALINRRYQQVHQEAVGFIGYFSARDGDHAGGRSVVAAAEDWLAGRAVTRVVAGYNGHLLAGIGVRTAAFESDPVFPLPWHPPSYTELLDAGGYRRAYPWWSYRIDFSSETYRAASVRAERSARCLIRPIDKKRWGTDLETIMRLYNETFVDEWEYHPITILEMREFFDPLKQIFDPNLLLIAESDGEPAGFCFGLPDWTPQVRRTKGSASPFAQLRFALGARRCRNGSLYAIGVVDRHRGKQIGLALASRLYRRFETLGMAGAEYHIVNDANTGSKALAAALGGQGRVLYHNFDKSLR